MMMTEIPNYNQILEAYQKAKENGEPNMVVSTLERALVVREWCIANGIEPPTIMVVDEGELKSWP